MSNKYLPCDEQQELWPVTSNYASPYPFSHWQEKSEITPPVIEDWGMGNKSYSFKEVKILDEAFTDAVWITSATAYPSFFCNEPFRVGLAYVGPVHPDSGYPDTQRIGYNSGSMIYQLENNHGIPSGVRANLLNSHTIQINDVRLDLGVELRELPTTIYFLRNALSGPRTLFKGIVISITKAMSLFLKGDMRKAARHLGLEFWWKYPKKVDRKIVANDINLVGSYTAEKWLELRYGWLPLVYSMQDAWDEFTRVVENQKYVKTYAGYKDQVPHEHEIPGFNCPFKFVRSMSKSHGVLSRRFKTGCVWEIVGMPDGVKLGLIENNIENIVWQGMFITFMIDAFFDVSKYLQALEAPMGAEWRDGYETEFLRYRGSYNDTPILPTKANSPGWTIWKGPLDGYVKVIEQTPGAVEAVVFKRTKLNARPVALPVPWFGDLDAEYFGDVAALWKTFFLKPKSN
jgi:hypothetical protein